MENMMPMPMMPMTMPMWFWSGYDGLYWLSKDIKTRESAGYAGGLVCIFAFGIILEGITWLRNYVYIKSQVSAIKATEALNR